MKSQKNSANPLGQILDVPEKASSAIYQSQSDVIERGNPLIEALPGNLSADGVKDALQNFHEFDPASRQLSNEIRFDLLDNLAWNFQVFDRHVDLYHHLTEMMRTGYASRSIFDLPKPLETYADLSKVQLDELVASMRGLVFWGKSHLGKTTSLERILNLFQQVLWHQAYQGRVIRKVQLSWLKVNWPYNSSYRAFCFNLLVALDQLLKTNYFDRVVGNGRVRGDKLRMTTKSLCDTLNLGLLVIDEVFSFDRANGGKAKELFEFVVSLSATVGVPIVLVCTDDLYKTFPAELSRIQSDSQCKTINWERLSKDGPEWNMLINQLWPYQYVRQPAAFTEEFSTAIYEVTKGLIGLVSMVFVLAQMRAITTGLETITPELIYTVADNPWNA